MLPVELSFRKLLGERSASTDWFCTLRLHVNVTFILYNILTFIYKLSQTSCIFNRNSRQTMYKITT